MITRQIAIATFGVGAAIGWVMLCVVALVIASIRIARFERERPGSAGMFGE
jgi:hypothetical protein